MTTNCNDNTRLLGVSCYAVFLMPLNSSRCHLYGRPDAPSKHWTLFLAFRASSSIAVWSYPAKIMISQWPKVFASFKFLAKLISVQIDFTTMILDYHHLMSDRAGDSPGASQTLEVKYKGAVRLELAQSLHQCRWQSEASINNGAKMPFRCLCISRLASLWDTGDDYRSYQILLPPRPRTWQISFFVIHYFNAVGSLFSPLVSSLWKPLARSIVTTA